MNIISKQDPINWTQEGAVTTVFDQGQCGSCWAFSAKQALESLNFIENADLQEFSAQMFIDCSNRNNGCSGGFPEKAFEFSKYYGIDSEQDYPYRSGSNGTVFKCQYSKLKPVFQNKGYQYFIKSSFSLFYKQLKKQPFSIELNAGTSIFQHYKNGTILYGQGCGYRLDHAVFLTGFDRDSEGGYWIVKNSWGTGWGQNGYVQLQAMTGGEGTCGCQQYGSWPF